MTGEEASQEDLDDSLGDLLVTFDVNRDDRLELEELSHLMSVEDNFMKTFCVSEILISPWSGHRLLIGYCVMLLRLACIVLKPLSLNLLSLRVRSRTCSHYMRSNKVINNEIMKRKTCGIRDDGIQDTLTSSSYSKCILTGKHLTGKTNSNPPPRRPTLTPPNQL